MKIVYFGEVAISHCIGASGSHVVKFRKKCKNQTLSANCKVNGGICFYLTSRGRNKYHQSETSTTFTLHSHCPIPIWYYSKMEVKSESVAE